MQNPSMTIHVYIIYIMCEVQSTVGRFSEVGLYEWMPFVIFCATEKSQEVAASLPGRFLSRCCFTLCITMEAESRIVKQYKCHHCCSCKNYWGKGMEGGKKCFCIIFWLTRRLQFCRKNVFWGILYHEQQVIACCQTHSDYRPSKMPLKLAV